MRIVYVHASKFGNGAKVAEEFRKDMSARGVEVLVHHVDEVKATELVPADLYLFSSPGRMGKPIRSMRRFLKQLRLPAGTRCAVLTTEIAAKPDRKTGRMPTEEEICRWQRVRPLMRGFVEAKDLVEVAEDVIYVDDIQGPLEEGWERKVQAFAARIAAT
jgi:menaquinone-dependent protoporphyrinogen IX oxidase